MNEVLFVVKCCDGCFCYLGVVVGEDWKWLGWFGFWMDIHSNLVEWNVGDKLNINVE